MNKEIKSGIKRIKGKPLLLLIIAAFVAIVACVTPKLEEMLCLLGEPFSAVFFKVALYVVVVELTLVCILGIIARFGKPNSIEKKLIDVGFVDKQGSSPMLLSIKKEGKGSIYSFYSPRIPFYRYKDYRAEIETALNIKIAEISAGKDMMHVIIKAISGRNTKQELLPWNDKYLSDKDFELLIGESYIGVESIDLSHTPSVLLGGASGSGKSTLLKLLLKQAHMKGAQIFIVDMKGGIDFPAGWHKSCSVVTDQAEVESTLDEVLQIMEERRQLLVEAGAKNISEYNQKTGANLSRIIFAFDEVAEVLDKNGLDKEQKAIVSRIESKLSSIARLGRAEGCHLILSTQRPDSEILTGQIKANIGYRLCGRCDKVLSQIILDSTEGAEKILPDDEGVFLTNTGVLFKAYYVDDDCLGGSV